MRGSIKLGKKQYFAMSSGTKNRMQKLAEPYREIGHKARVLKGRGTASKEYILYVLPKKVKKYTPSSLPHYANRVFHLFHSFLLIPS